jgi:Flp pilus assembly protein TadD
MVSAVEDGREREIMERDGAEPNQAGSADRDVDEARQRAMAELAQRLEADSADAEARTVLAALLLGVGRAQAALALCDDAPAETQSHEPLLRVGVRSAAATYVPRAGLRWLQHLVALHPEDAELRVALGDTHALLGALPASLDEFRRAAELRPGDERCRERIAITEQRIAAIMESSERYAAALEAGVAVTSGARPPPRAGRDAKGGLVYFVTFATSDLAAYQPLVNRTAATFGGIDTLVPWTPERLAATDFFRRHREILSAKTGAGYWLWKPYIILDLLERVRAGDWVVYSDVGRNFPYTIYHPVAPLTGWAVAMNGGMFPGAYIPDAGRNARWTKRDCFVRMSCDSERFWAAPQIQASFSLWQKNEASLDFVRQWLRHCSDRAVLTDEANASGLPDFPDFVQHRRDQSVLTNLALSRDVRGFGSPTRALMPLNRLKVMDNVIRLARKGEIGGAEPQPRPGAAG